jgi:hypothetical protein
VRPTQSEAPSRPPASRGTRAAPRSRGPCATSSRSSRAR